MGVFCLEKQISTGTLLVIVLVAPAHLYNNHTNRIAYASTTSNRPVMQWYDCGCSNCDSYLGYVTVANPY